jgi:16S rRNA (cytidine1402-2'-O)-methyltransferase
VGVRVSADVNGTLSIVALPIGNLADITYRAVEVLRTADMIAAEDTRHLLKLRRAYDITTPALSYHDFNEQSRAQQLVELLREGKNIALVSDAGTPLVSDPGYRVVRAAIEAGMRVTSVPGANAAVAALVASGLPPDQFRFVGFPPRTRPRRRSFFADLAREPATLVLYEAPHRLLATLQDLLSVFGDRSASVARNITKTSESYMRGPLATIVRELELEPVIRGEATIVIAGATRVEPDASASESVHVRVTELVGEGLDTQSITRRLMAEHSLSRRDAYALVVAQRARSEPGT